VVTARSEAKAKGFMERRARFKDLLEIVVTGDLTAVGAFDELANGADVIIHCASVSYFSIHVYTHLLRFDTRLAE
jgi:ribonuclease BN (tRNA processing enzyme)